MSRRYNRRLATKNYVNRKIEETQWSAIQRTTYDFENVPTGGPPGFDFSITGLVAGVMADRQQFTTTTVNTDNETLYVTDYKIKYIRVRLRCALGEDETTTAVS